MPKFDINRWKKGIFGYFWGKNFLSSKIWVTGILRIFWKNCHPWSYPQQTNKRMWRRHRGHHRIWENKHGPFWLEYQQWGSQLKRRWSWRHGERNCKHGPQCLAATCVWRHMDGQLASRDRSPEEQLDKQLIARSWLSHNFLSLLWLIPY